MPLSGVCLNQEGSFEPSDCAISLLDLSALSSCVGVCVGRGGAGLSTLDNGLEVGLEPGLEPCLDPGLCCHERVPDRARATALFGSSSDIVLLGPFSFSNASLRAS